MPIRTAKHRRKVKGSTVIIAFMYFTWLAYLAFAAGFYFETYSLTGYGAFPPSEITYATAALFIGETVSLARYKMAKEGAVLKPKSSNKFMEQIGIYDSGSFEEEAMEQSRRNEEGQGRG